MDDRFPVPPVDLSDPDPLNRLAAYRLALEALRVAQEDIAPWRNDRMLANVCGQLLRAAGSIAANIAEGYSRGSAAERRKFLEYALGSTRECAVWSETTAHPERAARQHRLTSIRRLLLTMIRTARESALADRRNFRVR